MTSDQEKSSGASRLRRLLKTLGRPLAAALLGAILGVICSKLPAPIRMPCELISHVLPAACEPYSQTETQ